MDTGNNNIKYNNFIYKAFQRLAIINQYNVLITC